MTDPNTPQPGVWPGWRSYLRGTGAIWRTGGRAALAIISYLRSVTADDPSLPRPRAGDPNYVPDADLAVEGGG